MSRPAWPQPIMATSRFPLVVTRLQPRLQVDQVEFFFSTACKTIWRTHCHLTCPHDAPLVDPKGAMFNCWPFPPFCTSFNSSRPDTSSVCLGWTLRCTPPPRATSSRFKPTTTTFHDCSLRTGLMTAPQWFAVRSSVLEASCHSAAAAGENGE